MPRFSFGINRYDTKWVGPPKNRQRIYVPPDTSGQVSFAEYTELLHEASHIRRWPVEKDRSCPWTAPFLLGAEGEGRGMDNVVGVSCHASFDLDAPGWTLERLTRALRGLRYVLYTTTSSRPDHQKWRIVVQSTREMSCEEYGALWQFVDEALDHALDHRTHNANRILFTPAKWYGGADNIFWVADGEPLSVDDVLAAGFAPVAVETYPPIEGIDGRQRPDGRTIITENMEQKFATSSPGGRFWTLLCQSAVWHAENEWELGDRELCDAAMTVSNAHVRVKRQDPLREAQRALAWASATVVPKSPLERLRREPCFLFEQEGNPIIL